jgi:hypothetical protein
LIESLSKVCEKYLVFYLNKMEKKYYTVGTVPKSNYKIGETEEKSILL